MCHRKQRPIAIPLGDRCCFQVGVSLQPAPGDETGDCGGKAKTEDDASALLQKGFPVTRERAPSSRWFRLEEGEEDWILEDGETDSSR